MHVNPPNYAIMLLMTNRTLLDVDSLFLAINARKCGRLRIVDWFLF